jgi:hypothetical protein
MNILNQKIKKKNGQLLKLSQAGRGCVAISRISADEMTEFGEKPILLGKLCLHCDEFVGELGLVRTHPLQAIFRPIQARAQVVDTLGYDIVVVGVPTKQFAVCGILRALPEWIESSRATRMGRTHPATATVLAVRSSIVISVLMFTILFVAVAVGHTHLLSKVL